MKGNRETKVIGILCFLIFMYELSMITGTGARILLPNFVYGVNGYEYVLEESAGRQMAFFLPVYAYGEENPVKEKRKDVFYIKNLNKGEMLTLMDLENSSLGYTVWEEGTISEGQTEQGVPDPENGETSREPSESAEEEVTTGEQGAEQAEKSSESEFIKHDRQAPLELWELADYETLVKRFYTIDAITMIGEEELDAEKLGTMDMTLKQTSDKPQILIYHTHSQEGFADSVKGDDSTTIVGVGEHLTEILEQEYGYNVLHHRGKYDVETRDSAYSRSLPEIRQLLEDNPSIEVVIDLHRDAVADESTRLVMDLDGRPTAKFMFFNGISRTRSTGKIDYLYNENLESNLAFSFQMKWKAEEYYPGLTRRNYLNGYRYNMHLCPKSLLIELGAQNNTLEEAMNACDPIAHLLHIVLAG